MATAPYQAQAELLQVLRQRDAELARLREERQHKETTIDFLKTKIVTLQNQNRATLSERPAPAVEDLQRRLDAALQAKDKALHRQEELSVQLQDLQMEVGDLRQELTQARAEVARLAAELEKAQHRENGIGAPTSTSVLLAVEELERELAQDVNHLEPREVNHSDAPVTMTTIAGSEDVPEASQVAASPKLQEVATSPKLKPREAKVATSPKIEPREAKATSPKLEPREAKADKVATSSASPKLEPRSEAASPKLEPREAKVSLPDPDEEEKDVLLGSMMSITSQDLSLDGGGSQVQVSATGALINFFDSSEDAAAIEAKRQRMARQIERRRQARRQLAAATEARRASAASNDELSTDAATEAAGSEKTTPLGAASRKVPEVKFAEAKGELPAWAAPEAQSARSHGSVRPGEMMEVPQVPRSLPSESTLEAETSPVLRQARGDSGLAPPGKGSSGSSTTPTLHSKFEGLRDEMKRRRSAMGVHGQADDAGESTGEAPVAQTSRSLTFGGASPGPSPRSSPMLPARAVRAHVAHAPESAQASPGASTVTSPPQAAPMGRGSVTVVSAQGARPVPALSFVAGAPTGRPAQMGCGAFSPGRQVSDEGRLQGGRMRPGQSSSVLVAPATVTSPARHVQMWREESQPRTVQTALVSGHHQTLGSPAELDRSRRNITVASRINVSASTGNIAAGSFTARPMELEKDDVHEAVVRFAATASLKFPLARMSKGVYNYGNKKLIVTTHNSKLMVRTGGGFATLEHTIAEADKAEKALQTKFPLGPQLVVNARRMSQKF